MIVASIDPGKSNGCIAFQENGMPVKVYKMKNIETSKDMLDLFEYYKNKDDEIFVYVESQSMRVSNDKYAAFRIQKLLDNYQMCMNVLDILRIKYYKVHPRTWQHQLRLVIKNGKETDTERKNRYKSVAQKFFPDIRATGTNQDALLLLEYGRRILKLNPESFRINKTLFD